MPASRPWINNTGNQQKESNNPSVDDLYMSTNVFVNGQSVILAGPPSASPATAALAEFTLTHDDLHNGSPSGYEQAVASIQSQVSQGLITQEQANQLIADTSIPVIPDDDKDTQDVAAKNILVLLFRGLLTPASNLNSSVQVDATATEINKLDGYRARVFNWEQDAAAFKEIQPEDQVVLYGFSKGGETVLKMINGHPHQKFALALTLDAWITVTQGIAKLPTNCTRAVNWFNPNWPYNKGYAFPPSSDRVLQVQDPSTPSTATHFAFPQKHLQDVITQIKSLVPRPAQKLTSTVNGESPQLGSTGSAGGPGKFTSPLNAGSLDPTVKISKHFTLGDVIKDKFTGAQGERFVHPLTARPEIGLSAAQVRDNLSLLAQNILDPIYERYPDLYFTSTQRPVGENKSSQHPFGQAADMKFKSGSDYAKQSERAKWIRDNLPYDQLILETFIGNGSYWIHCSYRNNPKPLNNSSKWGSGFDNKRFAWLSFQATG